MSAVPLQGNREFGSYVDGDGELWQVEPVTRADLPRFFRARREDGVMVIVYEQDFARGHARELEAQAKAEAEFRKRFCEPA